MVMSSGCLFPETKEENPSPVFLRLKFENINSREVDGIILFDIMISIDNIVPLDFEPLWMNIKVWVDNEDGRSPTLYRYIPDKYDYVPRNEPLVFYEELTGLPDQIDIADAFTLTGLDESYENGQFMIYYGGNYNTAGNLTLPVDFS